MKAAILGAGGLGRTIALELASDRRVSEIVLLDRRGDRSRALQSIGRNVAVTALQADVTDAAGLRRALQKADVAVNATLPDHNLAIMKTCLDAGCGYVDTSASQDTIVDQMALDEAWRSRGLSAIMSMGSDPGISNIMARAAAERFTSIDGIRVRWAATGSKEIEGFPLYSREIFLQDALSRPVIWDGQKIVEQEIGSGHETYDFPSPVGPRSVQLFWHEEVITLPKRLGKAVGYVDYKHAIDANLVRAVYELNALGLLAPERRVKIGDRAVPFREAFLAAFPEPSTLIGPLAGNLTIVVQIDGTKTDGSKGTVRIWVLVEHREANRRRGTTAEYFLTAACAAAGMSLLGQKKAPRPGVLVPEELPPDLIVPELEQRGVTFHVEETTG